MKETAIVTGANGFVGRAMVKKLLSEGCEVYALVTDEKPMLDLLCDNLHVKKVFYEDYPNLSEIIGRDIDIVYHFSWAGMFGEAFKDYSTQLKNAEYSAVLLEQAIKMNAKKYVLASSVNILEITSYLNDGEIKPRYTVIYAAAKLAAEMICKTIAYNRGIAFNCGLLAMVYGENHYARTVQNVVMSHLLRKEKPKLIEGNNLYDLIYIDDVVDAFYAIGQKGVDQKTYYIGHKKLKTFRELMLEIRDVIAPEMELTFGEVKDSSVFDFSKMDLNALEKDTGFVAKSDFKETIQKTSNWIKDNLNF